MNRLETELREIMRERAAALTSTPPMPVPRARRPAGPGRPRRRALALAMAAALVLGAGVAIAQVVGSHSVTPVSDRFVVASGETQEGPWQLTLYRARITQPGGDVATGWCLDLDGPTVNDPGAPTTERANICRLDNEPALTEPIGAVGLFPGFSSNEAFLYGEVSADVASMEVRLESGEVRQVSLVPAPAETNLNVGYFSAFVTPPAEGELVARDENGAILETMHIIAIAK